MTHRCHQIVRAGAAVPDQREHDVARTGAEASYHSYPVLGLRHTPSPDG